MDWAWSGAEKEEETEETEISVHGMSSPPALLLPDRLHVRVTANLVVFVTEQLLTVAMMPRSFFPVKAHGSRFTKNVPSFPHPAAYAIFRSPKSKHETLVHFMMQPSSSVITERSEESHRETLHGVYPERSRRVQGDNSGVPISCGLI